MIDSETIQAIFSALETVTTVGIMFLWLRYADSMRDSEKERADMMTSDIVSDWKKLRGIEDRNNEHKLDDERSRRIVN